jgi:hypothetical protein
VCSVRARNATYNTKFYSLYVQCVRAVLCWMPTGYSSFGVNEILIYPVCVWCVVVQSMQIVLRSLKCPHFFAIIRTSNIVTVIVALVFETLEVRIRNKKMNNISIRKVRKSKKGGFSLLV